MEWSTVIDWLLSHGVRILIILLISACYPGISRLKAMPKLQSMRLARR